MMYRIQYSFGQNASMVNGIKRPFVSLRGQYSVKADSETEALRSFENHCTIRNLSNYVITATTNDTAPELQINPALPVITHNDPSDTNSEIEKDADRAQRMIEMFAIGSGGDDVLGATELLVILRHWCDHRQESFHHLEKQSLVAYQFTLEKD